MKGYNHQIKAWADKKNALFVLLFWFLKCSTYAPTTCIKCVSLYIKLKILTNTE